MSPYRRNMIVGVTVLGALLFLGWMILKFGDRPARIFSTPTMPVTFISDRGDGLGEGSGITYRGVGVGRVKTVKRTPDGKQVIVDAEVDVSPPLPANLQGEIVMLSALGGTSTLTLKLTDADEKGRLESGATLRARFVGLQFLPPEFADLARELKATAQQFRESKLILHIDEQVTKAGKVLDSANEFISDPKMREEIRVAVANIKSASETINRVGGKLDKLSDQASSTMTDVRQTVVKGGDNVDNISKQVGERLTQIGRTLDRFESVAKKVDAGQGTAGQLVNDPKLYQAMVDSARELNATIADFKRLVEQWEQEGISFKLK